MLSVQEAKKIGLRACMQELGEQFCYDNQDQALAGYGVSDTEVKVFLGISEKKEEPKITHLIVEETPFDYSAHFVVNRLTGGIIRIANGEG